MKPTFLTSVFSVATIALTATEAHTERQLSKTIEFPSGLTNLTNTDEYHMKTVRVVQARVQGDKPQWNSDYGMFVSKYYTDFEEAYRAVLDTVNLASVEGALMYVQAEGINYNTRGSTTDEKCTRKNGMKYVVFYDIVITQTNETLALYESEYGTYIAMDSGHCTETSGSGSSAVFPVECNYLNGTNGKPNVGPFVGGEARDTDARAPYPDTWWYSYPNTCPLKTWSEKTDACRASTRGGLCPYDTKPDGIKCTYNYRILGWVPIDDLVGITSMEDASGNKYANFSEFCLDGGVEFNATTEGKWIDGIDFWKNPQNETANSARATKLVELYNTALDNSSSLTQVSASDLANFQALPTIASLRSENPPCYENVASCATATYGCKRDLYGQICVVCESASSDCVKAGSDFTFPTLTKATAAPSTSSSTSSGTGTGSSTSSTTTSSPSASSSAAVASASTAAFASVTAIVLGLML